MMLAHAVSRYKAVAASTSTPGELLLALYGGLFRYLRQARMMLEGKQRARAAELISRARAIVCELDLALDHDVYPELCANLTALYGFCLDRLRVASRDGSTQAIDEVIRVLTPLHQGWQLAVPKATIEQGRADRGR